MGAVVSGGRTAVIVSVAFGAKKDCSVRNRLLVVAVALLAVSHTSLCGVPVITGTPPGVRLIDQFWESAF